MKKTNIKDTKKQDKSLLVCKILTAVSIGLSLVAMLFGCASMSANANNRETHDINNRAERINTFNINDYSHNLMTYNDNVKYLLTFQDYRDINAFSNHIRNYQVGMGGFIGHLTIESLDIDSDFTEIRIMNQNAYVIYNGDDHIYGGALASENDVYFYIKNGSLDYGPLASLNMFLGSYTIDTNEIYAYYLPPFLEMDINTNYFNIIGQVSYEFYNPMDDTYFNYYINSIEYDNVSQTLAFYQQYNDNGTYISGHTNLIGGTYRLTIDEYGKFLYCGFYNRGFPLSDSEQITSRVYDNEGYFTANALTYSYKAFLDKYFIDVTNGVQPLYSGRYYIDFELLKGYQIGGTTFAFDSVFNYYVEKPKNDFAQDKIYFQNLSVYINYGNSNTYVIYGRQGVSKTILDMQQVGSDYVNNISIEDYYYVINLDNVVLNSDICNILANAFIPYDFETLGGNIASSGLDDVFDLISATFLGIVAILDIKIFGAYTLGVFLLVPLMVGIILFVVGLFKR